MADAFAAAIGDPCKYQKAKLDDPLYDSADENLNMLWFDNLCSSFSSAVVCSASDGFRCYPFIKSGGK